ncbi:methyltransferase domain-containing protein [uncultured Clostridium sp.]|uniref:methyltransferase domain-containing protein n=1 Tax=uncultured Clostridium sp. TaxID=59620 RepID=UPI0028E6E5B1|nr:methyltransferase domain-containing protein [uncultured Clostridium sp.]
MCIKSIKKKDRARELVKKNQRLFKCPVCSGKMFMNDFNILTCNSKHSFDLSKKGYLNLLTSSNLPVYSKELFEARHKVCTAGFYNPLIDMLAKIIGEYKNSISKKHIAILDAGCGEGSHIYDIFKKSKGNLNDTFVGGDISKDSINMAASNHADIIWCVADLARLPFQNRNFDVVLNMLSPANYGEFDRILSDKGIVIKVVPGSQYLKELRETIYNDKKTIDYSNNKVIDYFSHRLDVIDIQDINYQFAVDEELLPHFIKMTPLTWGKSTERLNYIFKKNISSITLDLALIIGIKKK